MSSRNELRRRADCCAAQDNNNKTMQATTNQATPLANHATPLADNHGYASCVHRQQSGHAVRGHGNNNQAARAANPHMATLAVYTAQNNTNAQSAAALAGAQSAAHGKPEPLRSRRMGRPSNLLGSFSAAAAEGMSAWKLSKGTRGRGKESGIRASARPRAGNDKTSCRPWEQDKLSPLPGSKTSCCLLVCCARQGRRRIHTISS